ncbi:MULTISPECIES: substrate-binding domain-containing protein [Caballeronia]|uniref:Periplasmic binding protein/LacI transcriptional regulator n=1 Tax=Caballeronia cordobensis TaxID=1353886 RepID=A0A158JGB7_CABCO|nr:MULTISPECIES: substrate-binding domain-containing protein [Caballeronia]MCE4546232.1 substrate-binding domain-containing protein [Caballeronia sp. PC1]MCE4573293.1 substrate-binding domain-containing protein [Caballeronia sp. CLC5]SAL67912.1 periplasmic binding protein/LacI transcriptional regulator [Caballeronia cordobensis]
MTSLARRRLLAACALSACGFARMREARAASDKATVALVLKSLNDPFVASMIDGARNYQRHYASQLDLTTHGTNTDNDIAGQIHIVETLIEAKTNAIVIAPADSKALLPVAAKAIAAGVIVIAIDNPFDEAAQEAANLTIPFVGPDSRRGAKLVGGYLASKLAAGDEVGIIEGPPNDRNSQQRTLGFKDAMNAAGLRIAPPDGGDWTVMGGKSAALQMLYTHPTLRGLLCANDNIAIGAIDAVRIAGKSGRVLVTGYNNIDAVQPMLDDGRLLATVEQFGARQAVFGLDVAVKALVEKRRQRDLSPYMETPVQLVTKGQAKGFGFGAS